MVDAFDPYHRWLGIPPDERPASFYRLLGVVPFEDDPEVIRDGAERQMSHVRRYALGPRAAISQQVLNELAAAKACLLDPEKKAKYDLELRQVLAVAAPVATTPPAAPPAAAPPRSPPPVTTDERPPPLLPARAAGRGRPRLDDAVPVAELATAPVRRRTANEGAEGEVAMAAVADLALPAVSRAVRRPWIPILAGMVLTGATVVGAGLYLRAGHPPPQALPLELVPLEPLQARVGEELRYRVMVKEPDRWKEGVRFELTEAPPGAAIDPETGDLRFTPEQAGEMSLAIAASSTSPPATASGKLTVRVSEPPPQPPVARRPKLLPVPDLVAEQGQALKIDVPLEEPQAGQGPIAYRLTANAPAGASIDPQTGVVTWIPLSSQAGRKHRLEVEAVVGGDERLADRVEIVIDVRVPRRGPMLFPLYQQSLIADETGVIRATAQDVADPPRPMTFSLVNAPPWVTIDPRSGVITCRPEDQHGNRSYIFTVRVGVDTPQPLFDEKPLTVYVRRGQLPPDFRITFPSGRSLSGADLHQEAHARRESDLLIDKCRAGSNEAAGLWHDERTRNVKALCAVRHTTIDGPAVFFYPTRALRQFVQYDNGRWDGLLACWAADGNRLFWGSYDNGQRDGLCCLFREDRPLVILEASKGKTQAVHLMSGVRIARSFDSPDEAAKDSVVGPALQEIDSIEADLRKEDHEFRKSISQGILRRVGVLNEERRAAAAARSATRKAVEQKQLEDVRRGMRP